VHAVDVDARNFEQEVLEASKTVPVVIDFWAPWCGPCKVLKPMLEKLAAEYGGKFRLARVNSDTSQDLAQEFGVRSIPDVRAIRNGKQVASFVGALPPAQLRAFIDKLIPTATDLARAKAKELRDAADAAGAAAVLQRALELDAGNDPARIDLAAALIELKRLDEAEKQLQAVKPDLDLDSRVEALRQGLEFARAGQSGPGEAQLQQLIDSAPDNLDARLALANLLAGGKRYKEAMDQLLEIIRRKKDFHDGAARKQMLAIFSLASGDAELVSEYRKKLASALY